MPTKHRSAGLARFFPFSGAILLTACWFTVPYVSAKDAVAIEQCSPAIAEKAVIATRQCAPGVPTLLTGKTDGFYFQLGQAIQDVGSRHGLQICALEMDQTLCTPSLLDQGNYDFGLVQSDLAHDAWHGHPKMYREPIATRLILPLYVEAVHILIRPHLNISRVADLKGRRVWLGPESSAMEYTTRRVLRAAGVDPDSDIQSPNGIGNPPQLDVAGTQLRTMTGLDAMFRVTVMPSAPLQDVLGMSNGRRASEARLLALDYDLVNRLSADGSYIPTLIPPEFYGETESTLTVGVEALLLSGRNAREADARALAETVRKYRFDIEADVERRLEQQHSAQRHADTSLSLLNVPTNAALGQYIYSKDVGVYLYNRWRDSIKPSVPLLSGFLFVVLVLVIWFWGPLRRAFHVQPNVFLLVGGTLAVWCMASAVLYHYEWSVNEHFNSFPRSLRFSFLYLVGLRGYSPLTPSGQTAADITKWISVALLGGFATPLVRQGWDWLTAMLRGWGDEVQKGTAPSSPVREPPLNNAHVLDMLEAGLAAEIIVLKIEMSQCQFDTSVTALHELKSSGVPDAVIEAMLRQASSQAMPAKLSA